MNTVRHIHFVGIKGVGMAPLAIIAKEAGFVVSGSDIAKTFITDESLNKKGIIPFAGFEEGHVNGADLVITTGAHSGYDNVEVKFAKAHNIPVWTQGEAVGKFMTGELFHHSYKGISVGGTHGKTTTTAMIASVLSFAGLDPSWVIGTSHIPSLGMSGNFGKGEYFVAEADEYANEPVYDKTPKMLLQHPDIVVITNVEHDHPDVYPTLQSSYDAFVAFANLVPKNGMLVTCGDDVGVQEVLNQYRGNVVTYGFSKENDYCITLGATYLGKMIWEIRHNNTSTTLGLAIPGEHNVLNATAAYIIGVQCRIAQDVIKKALLSFQGTKRRMEYVGQMASGALLYDDYAHHPTEIKKTLTAFREKYPESSIVCIFQPHTFSRTKLLFDQFVDSLSLADEIIMTDIYSSEREAFDSSISSGMLAEKIAEKKPAFLAKTLTDVVKYVKGKAYKDKTIVITMGAGDVYQIANDILQ
ncbi:MAG TPA: UDP-N-acetylmuramate--L-alanine ligase [Patescibacteria group bacterium]|nr:UDP-N-acetylmuramate--L-alanine ligase [Patescibacteria group bacterium]